MPEPSSTARSGDVCGHKECIAFDRCLYGDQAEPSSSTCDDERPEGHHFEPIMDENGVMMMWCPTCDGPAPGCRARGLDMGWFSLPGAW